MAEKKKEAPIVSSAPFHRSKPGDVLKSLGKGIRRSLLSLTIFGRLIDPQPETAAAHPAPTAHGAHTPGQQHGAAPQAAGGAPTHVGAQQTPPAAGAAAHAPAAGQTPAAPAARPAGGGGGH